MFKGYKEEANEVNEIIETLKNNGFDFQEYPELPGIAKRLESTGKKQLASGARWLYKHWYCNMEDVVDCPIPE